jgi:hypothetical protein
MISIPLENGQGIKRTLFYSFVIPDKFFPFLSRLPFLSIQALHLLALAAEKRGIEARVEIVFFNTDR